MDSVVLRLSLHQVLLLNPVWIRLTVWKWPVLLLLSVELDSESPRSDRPRSSKVVRVDAIAKANEVVEAVPVVTQWM
jgi:hypothetical protein